MSMTEMATMTADVDDDGLLDNGRDDGQHRRRPMSTTETAMTMADVNACPVLGACWGTEELGWNERSRKKLRDVR